MTFPDPNQFRLIVAGTTESGATDFIEAGPPAEFNVPDVAAGAFYWAVEDGHSLRNFGAPPEKVGLAGPDGSTFGISSFPAHSSGEVDPDTLDESMTATNDDGDAGMHASDTLDYEIVLTGKVDIVLPGGKKRTLGPGDLLVVAGVPHAWKNPYDEDCIYAVVTVGFNSREVTP
ncbi:cupin domain-containing protein [Rhodococcus sp. 14C212]|uniref:cupin domain-containing protein n=1 Tax=Rhodococcus sp. 14C212 TaxID=2711209 RepID=UPI0013EAA814|nr:cupin domain-containing protein [Rhodococcus sp. 14C212]NGP08325.1 cupin domain-containing protein [Rhodococcus sp. 14C212]